MTRKKATIYDVAEAAGVSTASVSSVLNGRDEVSPETKATIRAVMAELGYTPRAYTRKKNPPDPSNPMPVKHGQVLFLVPDPDPASGKTYQMQRVMRGAASFFAEFGLDMLVANAPADGRVPLCLREKQVKGVILRSGGELSPELKNALKNVPCVEFFSPQVNEHWDGVVVDEQAAGQMAFEYLHDHGCQSFAVLNVSRENISFHFRAQTFCLAASQAGFVVDKRELTDGECLRDVMPSRPSRKKKLGIFITGYNSVNSPEAVDDWLGKSGLTLDRGVEIICFGAESGMHPTLLATLERIGRHCAEQVVWRMQHAMADPRRIMVTPQLVLPETEISDHF